MDFHVIIPVRYASSRLPGKALKDIAGKPMVQHVYERSQKSGAMSIVIATDDDRIAAAAHKFNAPICMTSDKHETGTERIAEAAAALELEDDDIIVGVQGDEPLIPPKLIRELAEDLIEHDNVNVASVCFRISNAKEVFNPNITKVVLNRRNYALYFSRAPIPWERDHFSNDSVNHLQGEHYRHMGIYAYRARFLQDYIEWVQCPAEKMECLEQLRILWHGGRIHMIVSKLDVPSGVDTEADLKRVRDLF